jgi:hypothetical protein
MQSAIPLRTPRSQHRWRELVNAGRAHHAATAASFRCEGCTGGSGSRLARLPRPLGAQGEPPRQARANGRALVLPRFVDDAVPGGQVRLDLPVQLCRIGADACGPGSIRGDQFGRLDNVVIVHPVAGPAEAEYPLGPTLGALMRVRVGQRARNGQPAENAAVCHVSGLSALAAPAGSALRAVAGRPTTPMCRSAASASGFGVHRVRREPSGPSRSEKSTSRRNERPRPAVAREAAAHRDTLRAPSRASPWRS